MNRIPTQFHFAVFCLLALLIHLSACTDKAGKRDGLISEVPGVLKPPVIKQAGTPFCVNLDTCPAPRTTVVPTSAAGIHTILFKTGYSYTITPPESKTADFFVHMQTYTTEQGLPLSSVGCGFMDSRGNLWFGTPGGGASRYDGNAFTTYTTLQGLANNNVLSISEDKGGNLWFGTEGGVSRYDGNAFHNFDQKDGLPDDNIRCIKEDKKGQIWFGTSKGGVCRYDGVSFTTFNKRNGLTHNDVMSILEDKDGNLWFCTAGGGLNKFDGKSFTAYGKAEGLANINVMCMTEDKNGKLWFGSDGFVSRYEEHGGLNGKPHFSNFDLNLSPLNSTVLCCKEDNEGNLWFGTNGGGVFRYDGNIVPAGQGKFTRFSTAQGLSNDNVWSITKDKRGNLWFGTYGGGLCRYDGNTIITYTTAQGLSNNNIFSIAEDKKGNLWFGSDGGGVSRYDGKMFTSYTTSQGLSYNSILSITEDKNGNLWFGTTAFGVSRFDGKSFTNYTIRQGLAHSTVTSIHEDKNGDLWFGTQGGGVSRFDGKRFQNYTTAQGLSNNNVLCITEDKRGNLWMGTYGGGLNLFDGKSFTNFTTDQGLAGNSIWCITEDKKGNLWFGSDGYGVSILPVEMAEKLANPKNKVDYSQAVFKNLPAGEGIAENTVTNISEGKDGLIYLGTNNGIRVITGWKTEKGTHLNSFTQSVGSEPEMETYNQRTGYPIKDVNGGQHAMFIDSKGIVWIGTGDDQTALVRFNPSVLKPNTEPSPVYIQAIKLNDENIAWRNLKTSGKSGIGKVEEEAIRPETTEEITTFGRSLKPSERDSMCKKYEGVSFDSIAHFYPVPQHLELPYEHNSLTIDFLSIEPAKPYLINYQYILEGYDKHWSRITKKTSATFGNIFEGTYTFKLKAQNPDGIWSAPITYTFKVKAPWYRSLWMYLTYVFLLFLLIIVIYRWRTAALRKRQAQLEETVLERTAEVEEQKKEIIDSINYAKRLQQAILPPLKLIAEHLPESFVLYRPKDIVAGDFYWLHTAGDVVYIAVADCTGHGVPGAMVSIVCSNALNRTVNEFGLRDTGKILDKVTELVVATFEKSGEEIKDGMDISLLSFDKSAKRASWSGANNPLWIFKGTELTEIKADKQPIGKSENRKPFTTHQIELTGEETIYLITDGYADQFGKQNKKLMKKKFKEILASIQSKTMKEQHTFLDHHHTNWMGSLEQTDDVTIIGIRA
jgi:ligand-binding sensor domain-containing protein/serine phosphatase RsbU (regulator of sigma subunit)